MRKIAVIGNETIHIGRRGENQAIQIVWTNILENWRTMYGEGVVQLAVRRPKDTAPYPVACEVSGNDVMWTIQAADTAQSGVGECELSYIVDAVLVKSQTWNTMIARSLTGAGTVEPPSEPAKTWFTKIQTEIGNLEDLETGDKSNLVAAINEVAQSSGGGTGGTSDHTKLENRDADDQHPMSAITGLTDALDGKQPTGNYLTRDDLQDATDKALAQAKASGEFDGATGPAGAPGKDGTSGADGVTPHIGDNGNWYIGSTDTGKPSRGVAGAKGSDGANGKDGAQGEKGADGITPSIGENGNWYLGDTDTGKPSRGAAGTPGTPGKNGTDGHTPVKGTDYWTASDKAEVVAEAAAAIDLTSYAKKTEVPTKTSQLTNDSGFLTSHQDISGKQDKSTLEADVEAKGFTKNTGTYSKPAGGIPKADLAEAVQTSLDKADSALQSVPSTYRTAAAQDEIDSGKVDKVDGKGLSTNDYTAAAKAKVDAIPANPKYTDTVYDDTALKERVAIIEGKESAWDAKSDFSGSYNDLTDKPTIPAEVTPLMGTTAMLTPTQVYDAVSAGIPVKVQYTDSTYRLLSFTAFNVAESLNVIVSQTIVYYNGVYILAELTGYKSSNKWEFRTAMLAEKKDIPTVPSALKNPNALTIKIGSTTVTYDGSTAETVEIADGSEVEY